MVLCVEASVTVILLRNIPFFSIFCRLIHQEKVGVARLTTCIMYSSSHVLCQLRFALGLAAFSVPLFRIPVFASLFRIFLFAFSVQQFLLLPLRFALCQSPRLVAVRIQAREGLLVVRGILAQILWFR